VKTVLKSVDFLTKLLVKTSWLLFMANAWCTLCSKKWDAVYIHLVCGVVWQYN